MKLKTLLALCICGTAALLLFLFVCALFKNNAKSRLIRKMPEISGYTLYGEEFHFSSSLVSEKKTAILFFDPDCDFCRTEIDGIIERHRECLNVQWVFISLAPTIAIEMFLMEHPLEMVNDSFFLHDQKGELFHLFGIETAPELFIYDENQTLVRHQKGAISIKEIIKDLQ